MQFAVSGQRLTIQQLTETVAPEDFCNAQFTFDNTWRYSSVWANLEGNGVAYRMKVENGGITADNVTALPEGRWDVYLKGENYNENGTLREEKITNICHFTVMETEDGQRCRFHMVATPTPLEQTKFLALQALDLSREVIRMAQAGDFKGDTGPRGATGPQGIRGLSGAAGTKWFVWENPNDLDDESIKPGDLCLCTGTHGLFRPFDILRYVTDWGFQKIGNIMGAAGSDATVTAQNIAAALGYTPADVNDRNVVRKDTDAVAVGSNASANGSLGVAIGTNTNASGEYATALGYLSRAKNLYSIQIGNGENSERGSMYVGFGSLGNYKLIGSDGIIPNARLDASYINGLIDAKLGVIENGSY